MVNGESKKYFHELSHGERVATAFDLAISAVGRGGGFTIEQEHFQALQPSRRLEIAERLYSEDVLAFTADVSDSDEICVDVQQPQTAGA